MNIRINSPMKKSTNIFANEYIFPKYSNVFKYQIFSQEYFGLFWPLSYVVVFWPILNHFGQIIKNLTIFGKQWKFKYIRYHIYWTNEYPNIFVSINRWRMNIRIYLPSKKLTNIWTNAYIGLNIFKYIRISEYSSNTVTFFHSW